MKYASLQSFLCDPEVYKKCMVLWEGVATSIVGVIGGHKEWAEWLSNGLREDQTIDESAPIFSLLNSNTNRGLSIQQLPIAEEGVSIYCHLRLFGEGRMKNPIEHVHIGCELTESNVEIVKNILMRWVDPHTSFLDMQEYLDEIGVEGSR